VINRKAEEEEQKIKHLEGILEKEKKEWKA
jgi:hypothetical protein